LSQKQPQAKQSLSVATDPLMKTSRKAQSCSSCSHSPVKHDKCNILDELRRLSFIACLCWRHHCNILYVEFQRVSMSHDTLNDAMHLYIHPCLCLKIRSKLLISCFISLHKYIYFKIWFCFGMLHILGISSQRAEKSGLKLSFHVNWSTTGPIEVVCRNNKGHTGRMVFFRKNL
jgi:hypothetical protein